MSEMNGEQVYQLGPAVKVTERRGSKLHLLPAHLGPEERSETTLCGRLYESVFVAALPERATCLRCRRSAGLGDGRSLWERLVATVRGWLS